MQRLCGPRSPQKSHNRTVPGPPGPARPKARRAARSRVFASGTGRPATRGDGNTVIELEYGIMVYPAPEGQDRWRAVCSRSSTPRPLPRKAPVHGMISALVGAGVDGGYLANPDRAHRHRHGRTRHRSPNDSLSRALPTSRQGQNMSLRMGLRLARTAPDPAYPMLSDESQPETLEIISSLILLYLQPGRRRRGGSS
jgi:hypothetical protein